MKLLKIALACLIIAAAAAVTVFACPACPDAFEIEQGGETVSLNIHGDEFVSWYSTVDGLLCTVDDAGEWVYATFDGSDVEPTSVPVQDMPPAYIPESDVYLSYVESEDYSFPADLSPASDGLPLFTTSELSESDSGAVTRWEQNILVILIEFTDVKLQHTDEYWYNTLFSTTENSVNKYYSEISGGKFSFSAAGGKVWHVSLDEKHPMESYVTSESNYIKIRNDVSASIQSIDDDFNFSLYDYDNDGYIAADELHIVVIFAGNEASAGLTSNAIWAHAWGLSSYLKLDGVYVGEKYTAQGEIINAAGDPLAIGVTCHELGHSLGLPDLYDYGTTGDEIKSIAIGAYSLMGQGSWGAREGEQSATTPVYPDAWCMMYLGFADVTTVNAGAVMSFDVANASAAMDKTGGIDVIKVVSSLNEKQYFLISNRTMAGYDEGLAKYEINVGGILILHVDESVMDGGGRINDNCYHKAVDVEEANGSEAMNKTYWPYASDDYMYTLSGYSLFSSTTAPSSYFYTATVGTHAKNGNCGSTTHPQTVQTGINIEVTSDAGSVMTVRIYSDAFIVGAPESVSFTNGIAAWGAVAGADSYTLHFYRTYTESGTEYETDLTGAVTVTEAERAAGIYLLPKLDGSGSYRVEVASVTETEGYIAKGAAVSDNVAAYSLSVALTGADVAVTYISGDSAYLSVANSAAYGVGFSGMLKLYEVNSYKINNEDIPFRLCAVSDDCVDEIAASNNVDFIQIPRSVYLSDKIKASERIIITNTGVVTVLDALYGRLSGIATPMWKYYYVIISG